MGKAGKSIKVFIYNHRNELIPLLIIFLLASFLRLYNLRQYVIFLGDEGRDALVVKRMIIDHKFTLLGPTASVGGFYLGPVYYYFMIPFLWAADFDPVGPAVMVALFGMATVVLLYFTMRHWVNPSIAAITALLYATAPGVVSASRSSWNPNIMPFFALLSVSALSYGIERKKPLYYLISGICFGIAIQSHYLGLLLGPILAFATLINLPLKHWFKAAFYQLLGFIIGGSMYFAFEMRHGFPNIRSVMEFVFRGGDTTGPRSLNLIWLFVEMTRRTFEAVFPMLGSYTKLITYISLIGFIIYLYQHRIRKNNLSIAEKVFLVWMFVGTLGIGLYKGQLYSHYFGFLFPVPFILIGFTFASLLRIFSLKRITLLLLILLTVFNVINNNIWGQGSNLIDQTANVSSSVIEMSGGNPYNLALISRGNSDHAYRYFLEIMGAKPVLLEEQVTEQLLVICEDLDKPCLSLGHPLWEIAGFGRAEIAEERLVEPGIKIIRLEHHPDSESLIGKPAPKGN